MKRRRKQRTSVLLLLLPALLLGAMPARALPVPSKTAVDQSLAGRDADLALVRSEVDRPEVLDALAAQGFSPDEVHSRLAQLSPEELHALAGRVEQLQAAGVQPPDYIWIMLAVLIGVLIVGAIG